MEECPEAEKVSCLVTDAAANMIACTKKPKIRHTISKDFRTSTTAREKLAQVELQMLGPVKTLTNEVSDGWNRTYGGAGVDVDVPGLFKK